MAERHRGRPRRMRYALLLLVWSGLGMLAGALRYASQPAIFEASTRLYIHHIGPGVAGDFSQNAGAIRSQVVTAGALEQLLQDPQPFLGKEQLTARDILRDLSVSPDDMGAPYEGVVTIRYQGKSSDECVQVLRAIVASYQGLIEQLQHPFTSEFVAKLEFAHQQLHKLLESPPGDEQANLQLPHQWNLEVAGAAESEGYAELQRLVEELEQRRARLEGELQGLEYADIAGLDSATQPVPIPLAPELEPPAAEAPAPDLPPPVRPGESGPQITAADQLREAMTAPLEQQLAELSTRFGPDHIQILQTRKRLKYMHSVFETEPYLNRDLVERLVELQILRETYGEGHPRVGALKKRIEELRTLLRNEARSREPGEEVIDAGRSLLPLHFTATLLQQAPPPGDAPQGTRESADRIDQRKQRALVQIAQVDGQLQYLRPLVARARAERLFQIVTNQLDSIRWSQSNGGVAVHVLDPVQEARRVSRSLPLYLLTGSAAGLLVGVLGCALLSLYEARISPDQLPRDSGTTGHDWAAGQG